MSMLEVDCVKILDNKQTQCREWYEVMDDLKVPIRPRLRRAVTRATIENLANLSHVPDWGEYADREWQDRLAHHEADRSV